MHNATCEVANEAGDVKRVSMSDVANDASDVQRVQCKLRGNKIDACDGAFCSDASARVTADEQVPCFGIVNIMNLRIVCVISFHVACDMIYLFI